MYDKPIANIMLNRETLKAFPLISKTRHEYSPLSIPFCKVLGLVLQQTREKKQKERKGAFIEGIGGLLTRGKHPVEASGEKNHRLYLDLTGAELKEQVE